MTTLDASDEAPSVDASADRADVAPATEAACALASSGAMRSLPCARASIHVLRHTDARTRFVATARLGSGVNPACARVDSVSLVHRAEVLQQVFAQRTVALNRDEQLVADGVAEAALERACADVSERLVAYGMIVRGVDSDGPFEARCGAAEGGGAYPPTSQLACHQDMDAPPSVSWSPNFREVFLSATTSVTATLAVEHPDGMPAFTQVNRSIEMVSPQAPPRWMFAPLTTMSTGRWLNVSLRERQIDARWFSTVSFEGVGPPSPFAQGVCADSAMGQLAPYFLAKISGRNDRGVTVVSAEILSACESQRAM